MCYNDIGDWADVKWSGEIVKNMGQCILTRILKNVEHLWNNIYFKIITTIGWVQAKWFLALWVQNISSNKNKALNFYIYTFTDIVMKWKIYSHMSRNFYFMAWGWEEEEWVYYDNRNNDGDNSLLEKKHT